MTECINVYRATQSIARSLLSCGVTVTLMYRNVKTYLITIKLFHRLVAPSFYSFSKGDCEILTGSPSTGAPNRGGVPKICDFQPVFQKYRYRYRIPRYFKIPTPNTEPTWKTRRKYRIPIPTPNTNTDPALLYGVGYLPNFRWLIS